MSVPCTPGPWHRGGRDGGIIFDQAGWAIADCRVFHGRIEPEEMQANAAVMAAAPEQHVALRALVEQDLEYSGECIVIRCDSHEDAIARVRAAREALAKAVLP